MNFIKTNPHPEGKKTGDCVVRAIAIAETKKWIDVYDALCETGREIHDMPNMKDTYELYLKRNGYVKQKMPKKNDGKRYKVSEWADLNKKATMVINIARHVVTVIDGDMYDLFNCGRSAVGNYYLKN